MIGVKFEITVKERANSNAIITDLATQVALSGNSIRLAMQKMKL